MVGLCGRVFCHYFFNFCSTSKWRTPMHSYRQDEVDGLNRFSNFFFFWNSKFNYFLMSILGWLSWKYFYLSLREPWWTCSERGDHGAQPPISTVSPYSLVKRISFRTSIPGMLRWWIPSNQPNSRSTLRRLYPWQSSKRKNPWEWGLESGVATRCCCHEVRLFRSTG